MFDDEDKPKKPVTHDIGASLDALSIDELKARIALLKTEIERIESAISLKESTRSAASSLFKF